MTLLLGSIGSIGVYLVVLVLIGSIGIFFLSIYCRALSTYMQMLPSNFGKIIYISFVFLVTDFGEYLENITEC